MATRPGGGCDRRVERAIELIHEQIDREGRVSTTAVACAVNLSYSRLRHLFKEHTGQSIRAYVKDRQMRRARALVETTFLTIKEIMSGVGANDNSHFVRDFKRRYGKPPRQYRMERGDAER